MTVECLYFKSALPVCLAIAGGYMKEHPDMTGKKSKWGIASAPALAGERDWWRGAIPGYCELTSEERAAIGISDSLVRLVVGVENVDPLGTELEQALDRIFSAKKG